MKIIKFGGSSVGTPESIKLVASIVSAGKAEIAAVVVSAFQGVTDQLIKSAKLAAENNAWADQVKELEARHLKTVEALIPTTRRARVSSEVKVLCNELTDTLHGVSLIRELTPRTLDLVMSFGERLSAFIISNVLQTSFIDARDLIVTDNAFGHARVLMDQTKQLCVKQLAATTCPVVTGFIGKTTDGVTTTLGRGGSDYTAAILGAALKVSVIEIWTDVDGVLTADPRKVPKALPLSQITYEEAMELSHFGAKVIYPPTVQPAFAEGIPLIIKNTFNPTAPGTAITREAKERTHPITGISSISEITLLRIQGTGMVGVAGIAMRLFGALARASVNVILITQASSEHTICVAIEPTSSERAVKAIRDEFLLEMQTGLIDDVIAEKDLSIVSAVGQSMSKQPGISGKLFSALGRNGVNVVAIAQGSSELNISVVVSRSQEVKALNALHDGFFLSPSKTLNLFIAGKGLIGSNLLSIINEQAAQIKEDKHLEIKVVGLCRSRAAAFNFSDWEKESKPTTFSEFIVKMKSLNLSNSIFVDCTASDEVITHYKEILSSHIPIVTPNKRAQSADIAIYKELRSISQKKQVPWLYETSVGAGLPIINTLNDLLVSGDKILKIEAVLSGTMSYIFSTMASGSLFSKAVQSAKELGLTEPDPRDDLSGLDVARKLVILSREAGWDISLSDVEVESLAPPIDQDFNSFDTLLEGKRKAAANSQKKLCYIAKCEPGKAGVSVEAIGAEHPFFNLSGSDNIVAFTTTRYPERPLVVKGAGAGAAVTAAGVFADIIRVAQQLSV